MMIGTETKARKQFADQLEHHHHHLAELVFSRTAELAESRDAAEAANHAKYMFLATTGHKLLTPMNGIMSMTPAPCPSGAPTACHQARAVVARYILASPGLSSCSNHPLSENVRLHHQS